MSRRRYGLLPAMLSMTVLPLRAQSPVLIYEPAEHDWSQWAAVPQRWPRGLGNRVECLVVGVDLGVERDRGQWLTRRLNSPSTDAAGVVRSQFAIDR